MDAQYNAMKEQGSEKSISQLVGELKQALKNDQADLWSTEAADK